MNQKQNKKRMQKLKKRRKDKSKKLAILRVMREHNEVKYRKIPGQPGMWPYQLMPITLEEATILYETGKLPVRKGVNYMSDVVVHEQVQVLINGVTYNLVPVEIPAQPDPNANVGQSAPTDPSAGQEAAGATPADPNAPVDPAAGNGEANPGGEQPAA